MHRTTDRVKGFYAKTEKPARLNMSLERVPLLRTLRLKSALRTGHAQDSQCLRGIQNMKSHFFLLITDNGTLRTKRLTISPQTPFCDLN